MMIGSTRKIKNNNRKRVSVHDEENMDSDVTVAKRMNSSYQNYELVWAKMTGCNWWPGIIITSSDCGRSTSSGNWVFWFGDHKISDISNVKLFSFAACYQRFKNSGSSKLWKKARYEILQILAELNIYSWNEEADLLSWADHEFKDLIIDSPISLPASVVEHLDIIKAKAEEVNSEEYGVMTSSDIECMHMLESTDMTIRNVCISCRKYDVPFKSEHPYFNGALCDPCLARFLERAFASGEDGKSIFCIICNFPGFLIMCDDANCSKSFCRNCLNFFLSPEGTKNIIETSPWRCFFCSSISTENDLLQIKKDWDNRVMSLFSQADYCVDGVNLNLGYYIQRRPIRVLSLFDGIATGKLVLKELGFIIEKYYVSEIDEDAINVSRLNNKDDITYLGDVCNITEDTIETIGRIDLIIGGSPCNDLSMVNPARKGLYDVRGTGCLFFDFFRILNIVRKKNKNVFFLYENVAAMELKDKHIISTFLMQKPVLYNAKFYSPQNRARFFWGNIPGMHIIPSFSNTVPEKIVEDYTLDECILPNMGRKAMVEKVRTITTNRNSLIQKQGNLPVVMNGQPDILWATELERIFGFPLHYTDTGNLSIKKRRELLGRSWSVQVIRAIFGNLRRFFTCVNNQ